MSETRVLNAHDHAALTSFLEPRIDSSLFLLGNSDSEGLVDRGKRLQGTYAATFRDAEITAVAAHYWNGLLVVQGEDGLERAAELAVRASGRPLRGLVGPKDLADRARRALGAEDRPAKKDDADVLYGLDLAELQAPEMLSRAGVSHRAPTSEDIAGWLTGWRVSYCVEVLGDRATEEVRAGAQQLLEHLGSLGWILLQDGEPVAYSTFGVRTRGVVQVGGVYTPPALRRRGYGRAVVAASLLDAALGGSVRSVLFTSERNEAARRAYESLGFRELGRFALTLFE